jgi:hypothetical protein
MTNHANHDHPATPAARAACRKLTAILPVVHTVAAIDTPAGPVRVGSVVVLEILGEPDEEYTIDIVSDDIKDGRPGVSGVGVNRDAWAYDYQVVEVIKF